MQNYPRCLKILIDELSRLPGIGNKTAQRLAFFILNSDDSVANNISRSLINLKEKIQFCKLCNGVTESEFCVICKDPSRDDDLICVVENAIDIFVFEKINLFQGKYHVLGGVLSPLDGIGPDDINIENLLIRLNEKMEVVLATNSSIEGETTALYLSKKLNERNVKVSRLARGIPIGGDLGYLDDATIIRAFEARTSV